MFQDLEEATKLSTFWEKECNDLKAANALQVRLDIAKSTDVFKFSLGAPRQLATSKVSYLF